MITSSLTSVLAETVIGPVPPSSTIVPVETTSVTGSSTVSVYKVTPSTESVDGSSTISSTIITSSTTELEGTATLSVYTISPSITNVSGVATEPVKPTTETVTPCIYTILPIALQINPLTGKTKIMPDINTVQQVTTTLTPIVGIAKVTITKQSAAPTTFINTPIVGTVKVTPTLTVPPPPPPHDTNPPSIVQDFSASDMENRRATLRWTNPSDSDLAEVIVLRKMGEFPNNHLDGDVIYRNTSPLPGDHVEYTDNWVVNGRVYFYAVFSRDSSGNWNDMVEEGKNADTARPLNPNNKSPKASFEYYPTEPKVGKPIYFDASDSSDEDGWIALYEWDWDGDGEYDWFTNNAEVTFIYSKSGTYRVGLRVTDNDGATSSMTSEVKVAEWHFWDKLSDEYPGKYVKKLTDEEYQYILNELYIFTLENRDKVAEFSGWFNKEDEEIGEYFSKIPYQTIRDALDIEMDPEGSPGLTYGIYILNALQEMNKVELVWTGQYAPASVEFFSYLLETNTKWTTDRTAEELCERVLDILIELIGEKAPTLSVGMSITLLVPDCLEIGIAIAKLIQTLYYNSLRWYLERRYYDGLSHEEAWKEVDPTQTREALLQDYHIPTKDPKRLAVISNTFKRLYETYGQHLGNLKAFQKEAKKNLRVLLQNVLKTTSPVGHILVEPHSPIEIRVYDTYGNITGIINGQLYEQIPHSACDNETGTIVIFSPPSGCYYQIVGQDYGTYSVEIVSFENGTIVSFIARDIPTAPGATHQYIVNWDVLSLSGEGVTVLVDYNGDGVFEQIFTSDNELNHDEFMLQTATAIDIEPDVLNLKSKGRWITAYIEFPKGYNVSDINISSILLNGTIPVDMSAPIAVGDYDSDGIPDLMVKFNRTAVCQLILSKGVMLGNVTLTVSGKLYDGTEFEGCDTIRVRMPGDINMDGKVDMKDISIICKAFGSLPNHPRWNPIADENEDNKIDIFDIALTCRNYGKEYK